MPKRHRHNALGLEEHEPALQAKHPRLGGGNFTPARAPRQYSSSQQSEAHSSRQPSSRTSFSSSGQDLPPSQAGFRDDEEPTLIDLTQDDDDGPSRELYGSLGMGVNIMRSFSLLFTSHLIDAFFFRQQDCWRQILQRLCLDGRSGASEARALQRGTLPIPVLCRLPGSECTVMLTRHILVRP